MNVYDWMKENEQPDSPPLNEPGTREDPGNRPHVPSDDEGTVHDTEEHHQERTIADPDQSVEETVSNEGLIESVRKLFGVHNRGKYIQVDGDSKARYRNLENELKTSFADPAWVKQQTPIKGNINVKDISEKANLDDLVAALNDTYSISIRANNAMNEALKKFYTPLKPGLDVFAKAGRINDKAYEMLKELVGSAKPASELYKGPQSIKSNQVGRAKDTMPPMPLDEMVNIGSLVTKLLANLNETWLEQASMMESVSPTLVDPEFTQYIWAESSDIEHKEKASQYNFEAWRALGQAIDRKANYGVPVVMQATRQFEDACLAAIVYMERSIKGGKSSNEGFTVSNEGIFDSIKALFAKKPETLEVKYVDETVSKSFANTLLNDAWLDKQKFTDGSVTVTFPKAAANGDYKTLGKAMKEALDTASAKNVQAAKKHYAVLNPAFEAMNKDIGKRSMVEIQKLRDIASYDDFDFDVDWVEPKAVTSPEGPTELKALDKAGVKAAAGAIIEYTKMLEAYNRACAWNLTRDIPTWRVILEQIRDEDKMELIHEYYGDLESIADYAIERFYNDATGQWELVENLTYGLMRWITKSVSGVNFSE